MSINQPALKGYSPMSTSHKMKTLATFLATFLGGVGAHRFYMNGFRDRFGWLHVASLPISLLAMSIWPAEPKLFTCCLLVLSVLAGMLQALVIGLTPDDKWDPRYNSLSGKQSDSGWTVILLVVFSLTVGATGAIAAMARTFDLLYTGGSFG